MKLLVTLFFHSSSFLVLFYKDQEVISNHSEPTIPTRVLLYLIVLASCFVRSQREQRSKNSYHMPWRNTQLLAWRKRWPKLLWTLKGSKQGIAAPSGWGRGQILSPGSNSCPQITKACRSWCLLFHVHQIISYLKDSRFAVHALVKPQESQIFSCHQQGPVDSNSPDQPHPTPFDHWPGVLVQVSSAHTPCLGWVTGVPVSPLGSGLISWMKLGCVL